MKNEEKTIKIKVWENLQLLVLAMTITGQIVIGWEFIAGQGVWFIANVITLVRDFMLKRPIADKIKNATLTAITFGLCVLWFVGIF